MKDQPQRHHPSCLRAFVAKNKIKGGLMNKFSHYGKKTVLLFLFFSVLLALSAVGGSPPQWGNTPSLKAVLSPDDGQIQLSWQPRIGAAAYQVYRAPITAAPYKYTLLAEVPAGQTFFVDDPGNSGSVVYQVAAVGGGNFVYPLAAKILGP